MSSIRSHRTARPGTGAVRRVRASLAAAGTALLAGTIVAGPAQASLAAAGPVDPATEIPAWYQDRDGLKLGLCLEGPPFCLTTADEFNAPDGEAFFWQAGAELAVGSGSAKLVLPAEASNPPGGKITFARIRVLIKGARANTTYAVTHPYGDLTVTTDGLGNGRDTVDVGCGANPCAWDAAVGGAIGPFPRWDPTVPPAAPAGYVGDSSTPHRVVGSPTGSNVFRVVGGGGTASTDLFTVAGKLAGPPVPVFNGPASADFGSTPNGLGVVRTVTVTSFGLHDAGGASNLTFGPIGISGPQAAAFALVGDTCTGRVLPSGLQCQLTVRFAPGAARPAAASLDIAHNASGGASHVALGGTGIAPAAAPGPAPAAAAAPAPAPRAAVAGTSAAGKLAIAKLQTTHRLSRARALRRALRLTMRLPRDTEIVRIAHTICPYSNATRAAARPTARRSGWAIASRATPACTGCDSIAGRCAGA